MASSFNVSVFDLNKIGNPCCITSYNGYSTKSKLFKCTYVFRRKNNFKLMCQKTKIILKKITNKIPLIFYAFHLR